jgi:hypothetical protein
MNWIHKEYKFKRNSEYMNSTYFKLEVPKQDTLKLGTYLIELQHGRFDFGYFHSSMMLAQENQALITFVPYSTQAKMDVPYETSDAAISAAKTHLTKKRIGFAEVDLEKLLQNIAIDNK